MNKLIQLIKNHTKLVITSIWTVRWMGVIAIFSILVSIGCESNPVDNDDSVENNENQRNVAWQQTLNNTAQNWITDETPGAKGWCGDITHLDNTMSGPIQPIIDPSAGSGYAIVSQGRCNQFWRDNGFDTSGPYAFFGELMDEWQEGGFVQSLDIYLDRDWSAGANGSIFTFSNSIRLLNGQYPDNLRYFFVPITKQNGNLLVAGNHINGSGWYTFQMIFSDENGSLNAELELLKNGGELFNMKLPTTAISEEETSSFSAQNVGNGYAWFVSIAPHIEVPIDQQRRLH